MMVICITFSQQPYCGIVSSCSYPDMADHLVTSPLNPQLHAKQVVANITQSLGQTEAEKQQLT